LKRLCKSKFETTIKKYGGELVERDYSDMLYILYKDEFIYFKKEWHYRVEDKWIHDDDCCTELRDSIEDLEVFFDAELKKRRDIISEIDNEILNKEEEEQDNENKEIIEQLCNKKREVDLVRKEILQSRKQLRKTGFKNTIMMECRELFIDTNKTLYRYLDEAYHEKSDIEVPEQINVKNCILSPIELFVRYVVTEDTEYKENILSFTSIELVTKYNECMEKHNIHDKGNPISIIRQLNKSNACVNIKYSNICTHVY
jgi:hypothetical protein